MKKEGLLSDTMRARLTDIEYDGISKENIEQVYIQEYGILPPKFDIIDSNDLDIGEKSGFHGTAIHFHDKDVNEVYFINRGTEANLDKLTDGVFEKFKGYKNEPEKLKEIMFDGNEDIYTDIYTVLLGKDQFSTEDNIDFTNKIIDIVEKKDSKIEVRYFLDGHSLGGSEAQNILLVTDGLFTNVNVYNDAPMNIYNNFMVIDDLRDAVESQFNIDVTNINDLKEIGVNDLIAILDKEYGHHSDKITYYRNADDIMTTLTLPYEYRLIDADASNVKTYAGHPDAEMIDLVQKYPSLATGITYILDRANKEGGIRAVDVASLAAVYSVTEDSLWSFISQVNDLVDDVKGMNDHIGDGHSIKKLVENMAGAQGRIIVNNEEFYLIGDATGKKTIKLNIDEVYKFYKVGLTIMLGKQNVLDKLKKNYEYHVLTRYDRFRRKVRQEMDEIEGRPHAYLSSSDYYSHDAKHIMRYENLRFIENPPLKAPTNVSSQLEGTIQNIQKEIVRQEKFLDTYKDGIIKLVEEEERVALLFNSFTDRRELW